MKETTKLALVSFVTLMQVCLSAAQVNVTTYHNDNARTGQNTQESKLTQANVNYSTFGFLFSVPLDGQVYAQPLVLSNVSIGGGTHNVVYVATENDSVYAIDADTGTVYWQKSLGTPAAATCPDLSPLYGVTSTPVIDPSTGTLYVVAETNQPAYQLHAISVSTGAEKFGGPVAIGGTLDGITFDASSQHIRPALLLDNGYIFLGSGSHCDNGTWYGWVMAYSASTLQQRNIYMTEPGGNKAGVWMSGGGIAADPTHNIYFSTGNSEFDLVPDLSDSILKLPPPPASGNQWTYLDYFSPSDSFVRPDPQSHDQDVGSGGVLLLPNTSELTAVGKPGDLYLVNTTTGSMGEYCGTPNCVDKIPQEIQGASVGTWGSPAYWNGNIYFGSARESYSSFGAESDYLKAYSFNPNAKPQVSGPTSETPETFAWPTPTPSVSANGSSNGIVWALDNSGQPNCCAVLHAYDATKLGTELYNSSDVYWRDNKVSAEKFTVPTVANGMVYVGGASGLEAFGLLNPLRPTTDVGGVPSGVVNECAGEGYASPSALYDAYDTSPTTYTNLDTSGSGNGSGRPFCFGRILSGWKAAPGYTSETLRASYSCTPPPPFQNVNPWCAMWISLNGGSSWQELFVTATTTPGAVAENSISLGAQDLTKLEVAVTDFGAIETVPFPERVFATFSIYDVWVDGH